ncbi:MAG TPA: hypothetical protein VKH17_00555 [Acidimicrobiia bacterium]|nr:hypothetical protein [Acidimicrobiia bacterium]
MTARLVSDDDVANFGIGQAALFLVFGVSSIVLFAVVVTDFDRWTETLSPVPKGVVRRLVGRATKRVRHAGGGALAAYGAAMTWFWSRVGAAIGRVTAASARRVTWFWSWVAHAEGAVLANLGNGLTWFWTWVVRRGVRALIVYRAVMHRFWTAVGHGFAWAVVRAGAGLTWFWMWVVRGGVRALVLYRGAMQRIWSTVELAARWGATRTAVALRVMWTGVARGGGWTLRRCRSGLKRAWLAVAGRGDEATPKPIRRWYTATVDAAFGIPPDGTSVDVFGGRVAPVGRERRTSEPVGARAPRTPDGADDDAVL